MSTKEKEVQDLNKKKESSEDLTPPTNPQQDPPIEDKIDPNYVAQLESRIAEQQIQNRRLETLVESVRDLKRDREENQPPPPRNVEQERMAFYADPTGILNARDEKILKQMERMLEPLKEVATSFRSSSEYDRLKARVKNDPVFGKGLNDPDIERIVDGIMKTEGVEVTEDNIKSAVAQAFGIKAMGGMRGNGRPTPTPTNEERIDPPQIPTTRTRSQVQPQTKELTEDDRLAMKHAKLNPNNPEHVKEYWDLVTDETMVLTTHKKKETK